MVDQIINIYIKIILFFVLYSGIIILYVPIRDTYLYVMRAEKKCIPLDDLRGDRR